MYTYRHFSSFKPPLSFFFLFLLPLSLICFPSIEKKPDQKVQPHPLSSLPPFKKHTTMPPPTPAKPQSQPPSPSTPPTSPTAAENPSTPNYPPTPFTITTYFPPTQINIFTPTRSLSTRNQTRNHNQDPKQDPYNMVYTVRPQSIWKSMKRYKEFVRTFSLPPILPPPPQLCPRFTSYPP